MSPESNDSNDLSKEDAIARIKRSSLMWKFRFYGFFKNLKFFQPYLLIILLNWNLNLFQIGILFLFQNVFIYLLEIPSGIFADRFGKKTVLMLCFVFYIVSFIFYFFGPNYFILILASIFFGFGEAFRSGTHKAMELAWMERNSLLKYKSMVYGNTRSYSLYGSAISSVTAIIFILDLPASHWIFLITIIPYVVDFFLISTYPSYMNEHAPHASGSWKEILMGFKGLKIAVTDKRLRKALFSSSLFDAIFNGLKDYIQPIMKYFIAALLVSLMIADTPQHQKFYMTLFLGLIYAVFYIVSSYTSNNAHKFRERINNTKKAMDIIFDILGVIMLVTGIFIWRSIPIAVIFLYLIIYAVYNLRRPIIVDYMGDIMRKDQRATMLSVESLLKAVFLMIFAPLFGFIADNVSIAALFLGLGVVIIIVNRLLLSGDSKPEKLPSVSTTTSD